jgi:hypothetical protein
MDYGQLVKRLSPEWLAQVRQIRMHSGLASGCRIFKNFDFLVDMGSFNIQTNKERRIFQFPKIIVQKI